MKITKFNPVVSALIIGTILLSGCTKTTEQETSHYDTSPPGASAPLKPVPAANSIAYYAKHLDEAKKTWNACKVKGVTTLTEAELEQCANAQSAWEMQPYNAGSKR